MTPFWSEKFDNFAEASDFQRKWLKVALDEGWAIRRAELVSDVDFVTKKTIWSVLIRVLAVVDTTGQIIEVIPPERDAIGW